MKITCNFVHSQSKVYQSLIYYIRNIKNNNMKRIFTLLTLCFLMVINVMAERTGECGEHAKWDLKDDGTLIIYGYGDMNNYTQAYGSDIKNAPWYGEKVSKVFIEYGITSVGDFAFNQCSLQSVQLSKSIKKIGKNAFAYCRNLTDVTIPDNITEFGELAFAGCSSLKSINLPNTITKLPMAFIAFCTQLEEVVIPNSVKKMGDMFFMSCEHLKSIKLPKNLTYIPSQSFYGCKNLETIDLPSSVTDLGTEVFTDCIKLKTIKLPDALNNIGARTFYLCSSLESITIPQNVKELNIEVFKYSGLKEVTIPDKIEYIGDEAFDGCKLTTLILGKGLKEMGYQAFGYNNKLTKIICNADIVPETHDSFMGVDCSKCTLIVPDNLFLKYYQNDLLEWWKFKPILAYSTGIESITNKQAQRTDVYTLEGKKVLTNTESTDINALAKGIYLFKGKKFVVK